MQQSELIISIKIKYLIDSKIRSSPIQNKEALFVCSPKLYVRVHPNGSKYFEYRYTFHKKQRTKRIGVYGSITDLTSGQGRSYLEAKQILH